MSELKIIQIAVAGHDENMCTQSEFTVMALCADGSLWMNCNRKLLDGKEWLELKGPSR